MCKDTHCSTALKKKNPENYMSTHRELFRKVMVYPFKEHYANIKKNVVNLYMLM